MGACTYPPVVTFNVPKSGSIFVPAILALVLTFAFVITLLSIVKVAPLLLIVISPLSPSLIPAP